ncbi:hypothetical protein B0T25DRAFT_277245 [Lasiosphaeria hispida]|uniref:Uncharacterized protein n=1 Tax=Lasiosphaeria hispida TaxID=260671 RepID=A0AAJ0HB36_9PEZI|nr:hypothetical protein B0T25DRAFT_277245 [Lasiosphaeria hispida]
MLQSLVDTHKCETGGLGSSLWSRGTMRCCYRGISAELSQAVNRAVLEIKGRRGPFGSGGGGLRPAACGYGTRGPSGSGRAHRAPDGVSLRRIRRFPLCIPRIAFAHCDLLTCWCPNAPVPQGAVELPTAWDVTAICSSGKQRTVQRSGCRPHSFATARCPRRATKGEHPNTANKCPLSEKKKNPNLGFPEVPDRRSDGKLEENDDLVRRDVR